VLEMREERRKIESIEREKKEMRNKKTNMKRM